MENKKPWVSYDKISNVSDAFSYIKDIGFDLNDSFEHLNQGSPVRAKGIPTEKYTAGNTNDATESIESTESFLTQNPSSVARRYSPATKQEYSGYRPPDPVFMSFQDSKSNNLVTEGPTKYKSLSDFEKKGQKGFTVKQLASKKEEVLISPEAKEFLQMLQKTNPEISLPEVKDFQNDDVYEDSPSQSYNIDAKPIEIKTVIRTTESKVSAPIVINRTTVKDRESSSPIEVSKPVKTTRVSQYTQPIDFLSINNSKTQIIDTKLQNKILNTNSVNLSKISNDVNQYVNNIKIDFRQNLVKNIISELSNYDGDLIQNLDEIITQEITNTTDLNKIQENITAVFENKLDQKTLQVFNNFLVSDLTQIINQSKQDLLLHTSEIKNAVNNANTFIENIQNNTNISSITGSIETFKNLFTNVNLETVNTTVSNITLPLENIIKQTSESYNYNLFNNFLSNIQNINNDEVQNFKNEIINLVNQKASIELINQKSLSLATYINENNLVEDTNFINIIDNIFEQHKNTIVANANYFYTNSVKEQIENFNEGFVLNEVKTEIKNTVSNTFNNFKESLDVKQIRSQIVNTISNNESIDNIIYILNENVNNNILNQPLQNNIKTIIEREVNTYNEKTLKITENRQVVDNFEKVINESITSLTKDIIYKASELEANTDSESIANLLFSIKTVNSNVQNINNLDYSVQSLSMIENSIQNNLELFGDEILNQTNKVIEEEYNNSNITQEQYNEIVSIFNSNMSKYDIINKIKHYLAEYKLDTKFTNKSYVNNLFSYESLNKFTDIKNDSIESFISKIYKTSVELTNVSQSLINTKEILNIFQKTIDKVSVLAPTNQVVSELQEKLLKTQNQDSTNKFFNLLTSSNIVEEEIKNYLINKNESISNYTLNIIKENVYKSAFDDYIFVNEIKEIIEENDSSNSFTTLTEIKQVLNNYNLEEVQNAFNDIKNIIASSSNISLNTNVIEDIENYVNSISGINRELVQKTLVENKSYNELKNISTLNQLSNSSISQQFNNVISNINSQLDSASNVEQILNTINTELKSLNISQIETENNIFNQNSEFINEIYNSVKTSDENVWQNNSTTIKQNFLEETKKTSENIFKNQNIKIESIETLLSNINLNTFDSKTINQIKNSLEETTISNNYNANENNQLNYFSNYLNNLAFKLELIENTNIVNSYEQFTQLAQQTAIKYNNEHTDIKNEIKILNTFKNQIENTKNYQEVTQVISDFKTTINQIKNDQIEFVANQLIQNNEYKSFILENKEYITLSNLQETLETNSIVLNNEVRQVLNNVLQSTESLQTVVNNFSNVTEQNISSVYQSSGSNNKLSDFNTLEKGSLIKELNTIYSEDVVKQRFENFESRTYSNLNETLRLININKNLTVQQKIDSIASSISFMSATRNSVLDYLMKNFNVFNMEKTFNNLTNNLIEEVNLEIQNYDIQKVITNTLSDNIYINQNILNSQVVNKAAEIIYKNVKSEISNESLNTYINEENRKKISDDFSNEFKKSDNFSILNSIILETSVDKLSQAIQKTKVNNYDSNYKRLSILNYETTKNNTTYPENVTQVNTNQFNDNESKTVTNNIQVINNEDDVDVSNLRIDKIWNNFVKTEVNKIVEEINNDFNSEQSVTNIDQKINNTSNSVNNINTNTFNNEVNNVSNVNVSSSKNDSNYYSINNQYNTNTKQPIIENRQVNIEENTQINISEITQTIFEKIETRLRTYNVTQEDIILLKQKIIVEVTEYYEKRTYEQIASNEKKIKKEVEDMFLKFLNT